MLLPEIPVRRHFLPADDLPVIVATHWAIADEPSFTLPTPLDSDDEWDYWGNGITSGIAQFLLDTRLARSATLASGQTLTVGVSRVYKIRYNDDGEETSRIAGELKAIRTYGDRVDLEIQWEGDHAATHYSDIKALADIQD